MSIVANRSTIMMNQCELYARTRDSNPGPVFTIPGFGIGGFLSPGSRDPGGIRGSRRYDIKNRYFGHILLNLRFLSQRHRPICMANAVK